MGHGLTAIFTGGSLVQIEVYQNASGLARIQTIGGWRQAAIAAGGLLAPSIAGGVFIISGKSQKASSRVFLAFGVFIFDYFLQPYYFYFYLKKAIPHGNTS